MWVLLSGAGLPDGKAARVMQSLRGNSSITSVDLSSNQITEEGLQVGGACRAWVRACVVPMCV
jgi:hypothetical protein